MHPEGGREAERPARFGHPDRRSPPYWFSSASRLRNLDRRARSRRRSVSAQAVYKPCFNAFLFPRRAPLPGAPPCILHRRFPRTANDRHGFPLRVRAPHRSPRFIRDSWGCTGLFLRRLRVPTPRGDGPDDRLAAGVHVHVLDGYLLLPLAAPIMRPANSADDHPFRLHARENKGYRGLDRRMISVTWSCRLITCSSNLVGCNPFGRGVVGMVQLHDCSPFAGLKTAFEPGIVPLRALALPPSAGDPL